MTAFAWARSTRRSTSGCTTGGDLPGRRADLIVFSDLHAPRAAQVYVAGQIVAENGALTIPIPPLPTNGLPPSVEIDWSTLDFTIPAQSRRIRVIGSIPDQLVTEHRILDAAIRDGQAVSDPARDILKMAVIERHGVSGQVGLAFIQGFGLRRGAIAGTVAHDHHNLVVIGADDASMTAAVRAVEQMAAGWSRSMVSGCWPSCRYRSPG